MTANGKRLRVSIAGVVQGVGFRPFIYRLATEMDLAGWVQNNAQGVTLEVEGTTARLTQFLTRIEPERPPHAVIMSLEPIWLAPTGYTSFVILAADPTGPKTTLILPDLAACPDCLREMRDPNDRRYRYPFTNCTNCGPRFSIIDSVPYDRPNTTMRDFALCDKCRMEYEDPCNRRFHAQPIACPQCGPQLELWDAAGHPVAGREAALVGACRALRDGLIVAVKGLGGFHLMVDARNETAVRALRLRKGREEKPFALMVPSIEAARLECEISPMEERMLLSAAAPILLLRRRAVTGIAPAAAPGSPNLGLMLPYTPLHHLMLESLGFPIVATSGNRADEPLCTDEVEAGQRLRGIADQFLVHNRRIARHVDDSVARVMAGQELVMRRARGWAPLPVELPVSSLPVLAVGAHLKNCIAVNVDRQVFVSQHIGDLETPQAFAAFERVVRDLQRLFGVKPEKVVCDLHPDYRTTAWAERCGLPILRVQHHAAHVYACMAENGVVDSVLGIAWDGTGYGEDGTVWGGEFLQVRGGKVERAAHLRTFALPGGDKAAREPRRAAFGLLYSAFGEELLNDESLMPVAAFTRAERTTLITMLNAGTNCPQTSSAGRLFDAVAALAGVRQTVRYEGQAAIELEHAAEACNTRDAYPIPLRASQGGALMLDWEPMLLVLLEDLRHHVAAGVISAKFHNGLIDAMVEVAERVGEPRVALCGGCFLNARLLEGALARLGSAGFEVLRHQRVPPGDGAIALGQVFAAALNAETEK